MVQKLQREWRCVRTELNARLAACDESVAVVSRESGADYFAVRRYLASGEAKNRSANAEALCKYFGVALYESAKPQPSPLDKITGVIRDVWDGSEPHAELIIELIKGTKPFNIGRRR